MPNQRIPCKTSDAGNKYVLIMTDAFTKYVEIVAIPNKEAVTVADAIFTNGYVNTDVQQSSTQPWKKNSSTKLPQNCMKNWISKDQKPHQYIHNAIARLKFSTRC